MLATRSLCGMPGDNRRRMDTPRRYDIFCRVVDNYGDAGVCWRLARLLAHVYGCEVTLWIDDASRLAALLPALDAGARAQRVDGVFIRIMPDAAVATPAQVIIEAFGCGLPDGYLEAMAGLRHVWINLEYLSAEPWVDSRHGLPSPQPLRPLTRWFFFPGFTPRTGGLMREPGLLNPRDRGVGPIGAAGTISLFCYENRALPALLDAWAGQTQALRVEVPEGVAAGTLAHWVGGALPAGRTYRRGNLVLAVQPWLDQAGFDQRLWHADLNIVRGEDSFVRAQWAARPFVWHIYPQADNIHRDKLAAFLGRYLAAADPAAAAALQAFWLAFDREDGPAAVSAWPALWAARAELQAHGQRWAAQLASLPELGGALVDFAEKRYN